MGNSASSTPVTVVESRTIDYYNQLADKRLAGIQPSPQPSNQSQLNEPPNNQSCRVCVNPNSPVTSSSSSSPCYAYSHSVCPLNRAELGRASWAYLHTLAAFYPENPSEDYQREMKQFLYSYSKFYPCGYCADRTNEELIRNPPRVKSQSELSQWMCEVHNEVNERINKPTFDCSLVDLRWKFGVKGQCD
jgi:FAD-linked sulfhydryl oxidase